MDPMENHESIASSPSVRFDLQDPVFKMPSSPPPHASSTSSRKLKKPPPITPKRFTRFFTPRSSVNGTNRKASLGASGRQLQDITRTAVNRRNNVSNRTPRKTVSFGDDMVDAHPVTPAVSSRKRKTVYPSPDSSPLQPSPSKRPRIVHPPAPRFHIFSDPDVPDDASDSLDTLPDDPLPEANITPLPIRRLKSLGGTSRILQRSFGGASDIGRGFIRDHGSPCQAQTADFYTENGGFCQLQQGAPPFCTAPCNSNSVIAVGDEDGYVHLLDTDEHETKDFTNPFVTFQAHGNAIMDVQFSSDDKYLATASGDQTTQIIDAETQKCVHILAKHRSSVKQVRFQPGDDNIVATSSRDGAVQIWDLRCSSTSKAVHSAWGQGAPYASPIRNIIGAHVDRPAAVSGKCVSTDSTTGDRAWTKPRENMGKSEAFSRRLDVSVTALSFLGPGRGHLFLTGSDASTSVKLWDIRGRYSLRGPPVPISTTYEPESHNRHRHFAVNSLTLSGDGTRFYALSKDNTVYAYSTSHLILGEAPELGVSDEARPRYVPQDRRGLGPLYGFRHKNFHAGSFYVKAALRKASGTQCELLAVGSTDGCPVLFPTDENFLKREIQRNDDADELPSSPFPSSPFLRPRPALRKSSSFSTQLNDTIPIYDHGTPLIRGHDAEVTSVSWAQNGALVSVGDDHRVRLWREGPKARELRLDGEGEGKRWRCGWASVSEGYDDEDEE